MNKLNKVLDNKKYTIIIIILNIVVIAILVMTIISKTTASKETFQETESAQESVSKSVIATNNEHLELINNIIKDASLSAGNLVFSFGSNGEYSGFFDSDNPDVEGYHYTLESKGINEYLNIYNSDYTRMMSYRIDLSEDGDVLLYYDDNADPLQLSFTY